MRISILAVITVLIVVAAISHVLILPKNSIYSHELTLNTYANGAADFSVDATSLVRNLGFVSLMTLILGLTAGAAVGLGSRIEKTYGYEEAIKRAGFVKITQVPNGTAYQLTELGKRFLKDYAFLKVENLEHHPPS